MDITILLNRRDYYYTSIASRSELNGIIPPALISVNERKRKPRGGEIRRMRIVPRLIIINGDDRYSGDGVAHSMFGPVGSELSGTTEGSDSMSQGYALINMRPRKPDNKCQSLNKATRIQTIRLSRRLIKAFSSFCLN